MATEGCKVISAWRKSMMDPQPNLSPQSGLVPNRCRWCFELQSVKKAKKVAQLDRTGKKRK